MFAEYEYRLNRVLKDGSTERANLVSAANQGNRDAQEKLRNSPKLPGCVAYLWAYFCQLDRTRFNFGFGPLSLQMAEIEAWGRLHHVKLDVWELDAILELDRLFLADYAEANKKQEG